MHYELNVTRWKDGRRVHWFATHERSIQTAEQAKELADALRVMPDVAQVDVIRYETIGKATSI